MRVVEPKNIGTYKKTKSNKKRINIYFVLLFIILFAVIGYLYTSNKEEDVIVESTEIINNKETIEAVQETPKTGLRTFDGNEFRLLYDNFLLPKTEKVGSPPVITGDDIADARIRQLSEARGYRLRTSPSSELSAVDGVLLQNVVHKPWKELQTVARDFGLIMTLTSGYRSVEEQRVLFLSRLQAEGVSVSKISNGTSDNVVTDILIKAAAPGYSKHHSGYTIDIKCEGWEFENFKNSKCNDWLVADNYKNAKLYGFIPSYPIGADLQGPDPEAWEYVYVGQEVLNY
jgi:LAS superfamily LD-carboxypeptidase LdcB